MGPKRKKGKADDAESRDQAAIVNHTTREDGMQVETTSIAQDATVNAPADHTKTPTVSTPALTRSTWSWRPKATPTAEVARESISVAQGSTSESSSAKRPPNSVSKSVRGSRKSIPLAAEATKVHATSDSSRPSFSSPSAGVEKRPEEKNEVVVEDAQLPPNPVTIDEKSSAAASRQSWFGWWSRPDGYTSDDEQRKAKKQKLDIDGEVASNTPLPGTPADEPSKILVDNARQFEGVAKPANSKVPPTEPAQPEMAQKPTRSWFGLWSTAQNEQAVAVTPKNESEAEPPEITVSSEPSRVEDAVNTNETTEAAPTAGNEPSKPSGWVFWSTNKTEDRAPTPGGTQKQVGELAVADTPSQTNPEAAQFNEQRDERKSAAKTQSQRSASLLRPNKRGRPEKVKESSMAEGSSATTTPAEQSPAPSQAPTPSETPPPSRPESQPPKKTKVAQKRPNLILPSFRDTYAQAPNPSYVERLSLYLGQSLRFTSPPPTASPSQHISISASPPKVRKAVALGIHGFFPAALLQKVLGQPTGTSIRFANYAASAIKNWCAEHQPNAGDVEVETVALEGEGYIADRVSTLWKLLLNWLSHLRNADFILVACHSQGVPVAIMLLAKLIRLGALSSTVRIGVCAMAGINMGPFLEYKSRFFGGTALELFEFCDCESVVSKSYAESMEICLKFGVRVTFVGSIDDQLVSLESALFAPLTHPYVARAVFVDGRLHAPNFLTHLVVFALKLRNLGVGDHGLIRELSVPLAGSLVGGEGHSRIYDDEAVYRLAVEFALESTQVDTLAPPFEPSSTSASGPTPLVTPYEPPPNSTNTNPFFLPFAVRGMLEQDLVRNDVKMRGEVDVLVREFETWSPTSKVLRDVKWRLEGMKSMR